jgi:hypothetical protein
MQLDQLKRRDFITLLSGAAAAWPIAARAQSAGRMRRVGIVMPYPKGDAEYETALVRCGKSLQSSDGRKAAIFNSTSVGPPTICLACGRTQQA